MYSYDGLKDCLTNLASPAFFYEELRRGVSRVERNAGQLTIIRLVLRASSDIEGRELVNGQTLDDLAIVRFADVLIRLCRGEDLCARLGSTEFLVLLFAPESVAENYIKRIVIGWHSVNTKHDLLVGKFPIDLFSSFSSSTSGLSPRELLENLDNETLVLTR